MRAVEFLAESKESYQVVHSAIKDLLPMAMEELGLTKLPEINIFKSMDYQDQPTFGSFSPSEMIISLGIDRRHPIDICRTLAHELVHFKQQQENKLNANSGETGSDEENEANSVAGIIMRKFNKAHPKYING
jgi:hypothetical protein